jgi:PHD/YefM family antitoxin component YafN of YafNO toxin-antitoxin module
MKVKEELITVPKKEYEEMKETLEILVNPKTAMRILESISQAKRGLTISEKEFVQKFDL